jgi:hypothetical protein
MLNVCHPCADLAKLETEKHCSQCETQICSTEELPQTLMHSARTRRTHANARGVLLEAAFSFFLGRGKIKLHQHAESQLIFPNPKTVDILQSARVKPTQQEKPNDSKTLSSLKARPTYTP